MPLFSLILYTQSKRKSDQFFLQFKFQPHLTTCTVVPQAPYLDDHRDCPTSLPASSLPALGSMSYTEDTTLFVKHKLDHVPSLL